MNVIRIVKLNIFFDDYYIINNKPNSFQVIEDIEPLLALLGQPHDEKYEIRYLDECSDETIEKILEDLNFTWDEMVTKKLLWNTLCYIVLSPDNKYYKQADKQKIFDAMWANGSTGEENDQ